MAKELSISYPSGLTVYAIIRRRSDNYVWNGAAFEAWSNANIATYDVALTDRSGDEYNADFPSAITSGTYGVNYYVQSGGSPAITDALIGAEIPDINWNGTAVTGSANVGANQCTVASLVQIIETTSRKAGRGTATGSYILTEKHLAIQGCLSELIERAHCTPVISEVTLPDGDETIDFSGLTGFAPWRILGGVVLATPSDDSTTTLGPRVRKVAYQEVMEYRNCRGVSDGFPCLIGFSSTDGDNLLSSTADQDYDIKVKWYTPLTSWTPGDSGAGTTVVNVPASIANEAVRTFGGIWLQGNDKEQMTIAQFKNPQWEAFVARSMGKVNFGETSIRRSSARELRGRW